MRICRYRHGREVGFGVLEDGTVAAIGPHPFGPFQYTGTRLPGGEVRLLAPVLPTTIVYPSGIGRIDYEGELAAIIGKLTRRVDEDSAMQAVLGFTCANDVTARDLQKIDGQWTRAKSFDSFCPLGPWIETDLDSSDLALRTLVNGEARQSSRTSRLERGVASLIAFGDRVEVEIEGIGVLRNPVIAEPV